MWGLGVWYGFSCGIPRVTFGVHNTHRSTQTISVHRAKIEKREKKMISWLVLSALLGSARSLSAFPTFRMGITRLSSRSIVTMAAEMAETQPEECTLMRVLFNDRATVDSVMGLLRSYPFEKLRNSRAPEWSADGLRLTFEHDEDSSLYGGLAFSVAQAGTYPNPNEGPTLDVVRISEGLGEMAPVIREKQACKKVSRHLEEHESYASTRLRSFGDPFQLPKGGS